MAPYSPLIASQVNTTIVESVSNQNDSNPFYDFGTVFGIDSLFIIIASIVIFCILLCIFILCIHRCCRRSDVNNNKKSARKSKPEIVNGMELHYKYTIKNQSFNAGDYQSSLGTDRNTISVPTKSYDTTTDNKSFELVINDRKSTVTQNQLQPSPSPRDATNSVMSASPVPVRLQMQNTFSHSQSSPYNMNNASPRAGPNINQLMTSSASPRTAPQQQHSPRFMHPLHAVVSTSSCSAQPRVALQQHHSSHTAPQQHHPMHVHRSASPRNMNNMNNMIPTAVHQQYRNDPRQYYQPYHTMPMAVNESPNMMQQIHPQSFFPLSAAAAPVPVYNNNNDDCDNETDIQTDAAEFAETEAMTDTTEEALTDTGTETETEYAGTEFALTERTEMTETVPLPMDTVVVMDTLTTMVKQKTMIVHGTDTESVIEDVASIGGSSIGFNMEPSVASANPYTRQPSQATLYSNY